MLFNSFQFLIFFPIVVMLYFAAPPRYRWGILLAGSYYFYACWKVEYLTLIVVSTLIDYVAAIQIDRAERPARRRFFLGLSLFVNLGFLFTFKYYNFFGRSLNDLLAPFNVVAGLPELDVLLPVGISFYTFQTLSYTIDVYRGRRRAERHLGIFAVYVSFFPQLVAGPIERSTRLLPQFFEAKRWDAAGVQSGLRQMLWGFLKKIVIADRLALYVEPAYSAPGEHSGAVLLLASVFFAFQIYCDFSGYSDIAIGAARIMGYDLMTNFRQPYFSRSIREFWQRWHISLSTWFRDYVYIPLGGSRAGKLLTYRNLLVTFVVSGLWHGANWTFVVWGLLHGLYLAASNLSHPWRDAVRGALRLDRVPWLLQIWQVASTFTLVLFGWVFFRAESLGDALLILERIGSEFTVAAGALAAPYDSPRDLAFLGVLLALFTLYDWGLWRGVRLPGARYLRVADIALQFWVIVVYGVFDNLEFIYFQF